MNFNRRQNRIAGPGFHCNVRYDDQTMARAHSQVNQCHPKLKLGTTQKENFDVKEQELLVTMAKSGMYHDGYTHCFSFVNGLPGTDGLSNSVDELEEGILSMVRYVGVATTEYKPSRAYSEQGFVAQVGGVSTLINESQETIKPGDTLCLGVNLSLNRRTTRDKGIPREKIRFCVKKAKVGDALINAALAGANCASSSDKTAVADAKKEVARANKVLAAAKKAKKADVTAEEAAADAAAAALQAAQTCPGGIEGLKGFLSKLQEMNSRVIGRSCSYARPGDRLEVVLQPRNPY